MNKKCSKCKAVKPLTEFNLNRNNKDGYQDFCRTCLAIYHREHYERHADALRQKSRIVYWADPQKAKDQAKLWRKNNPARVYAKTVKMRKKYPEKDRARHLVDYAKHTGKLKPSAVCEQCGNQTILEAHHLDYSKPLQVRWLCQRCHRKLHR